MLTALRVPFPGLADVHVTSAADDDFFGSNLRLQRCMVSSGRHPALKASWTDAAADDDSLVFSLSYEGQAAYAGRSGNKVIIRAREAAILPRGLHSMESTAYGGVVFRLPAGEIADRVSLALDDQASLEETMCFDLRSHRGVALLKSIEAAASLYDDARAGSGLYDDMLMSAISLFVAAGRTKGSRNIGSRHKALVDQACEAIRKSLKTEFTIRELSSYLGVSERALQMAFQAVLNQTPKQWVASEKLEAARLELMGNPSARIAEVAEDFGFSSSSHFSSAFRGKFGYSPRNCRNS